MNIRHFFDNIDEKTIDRITEKYPPLSSDDKERLYAMSKNKYNSEKKENKNDYSEVMGVERYLKPVWHKVVSAVAAAVVVLGGVGGGAALIRRNNDADILKNESSQLAEIEDIAQQLTDDFFDLKNIISSRGAAYDENDILTYKIGIFDDALENPDQYTYERIFFKVTDERFSNAQDIYNALKNITSSTYFSEERYENATIPWEYSWDYENEKEKNLDLFYNLGTDVSMFENGSEVGREYFLDAEGNPMEESPIDFEDDFDWEAPRSIWMADYVEYNGSLYMLTPDYVYDPVGVVYDYNEKIEITDVTNDSFTVIRYADISHNENIIKRAEFKFVRENGEWLIDKFSEAVLDTEGIGSEETDFTATAQQLTDKVLEFEKILLDADIEYDENDSILFYRYDSFNPDAEDEEVRYCRVTDERFNSCQDIYTSIRSFTSFEFNPQDDYRNGLWIDESSVLSWLGNDLSEYEIGARIERGEERLTLYTTYNGQLYVQPINTHDYVSREYTSDVSVGVTCEDRFTATREKTKYFSTETQCSEIHFDFILEAGKWKIDKVYLAGEESEDVTESEDEYDYTAIATELSDKYLELENIICFGGISYDENEMKSYTVYDSFDEFELIFYKVTDPRFTCEQDFYDEIRSIHTNQRYPDDNFTYTTFFAGCNLDSCFGGELSEYAANGRIDLAANYGNGNGYSLLGVYCYYNGELYVTPFDYDYELAEYTSDVIIKETGENSFTATRKFKSQFNSVGDYYKVFEIVLENGEWKIDNVERVVSDEEAIGNAIASYVDTLIRSDTDKYGNIYENPDVVDFSFEIVGYNGENNCTARVILTDYDYVDIIELTAEIDIKEQKVINAEIIELQ